MLKLCRTKYLGDWSAACILGLLTGLIILILQRYMSADAVHQLLTFNPADFFTYALSCLSILKCACLRSGHIDAEDPICLGSIAPIVL